MSVVSDLATRRNRRIVLLLLLAALSAPLSGASVGDPCCASMQSPCAGTPAPCASLAAAPCCEAAPAVAWPNAQREKGQPTPALLARGALLAAPLPLEVAPAADLEAPAAALRLSVVLRN